MPWRHVAEQCGHGTWLLWWVGQVWPTLSLWLCVSQGTSVLIYLDHFYTECSGSMWLDNVVTAPSWCVVWVRIDLLSTVVICSQCIPPSFTLIIVIWLSMLFCLGAQVESILPGSPDICHVWVPWSTYTHLVIVYVFLMCFICICPLSL